jgi:hypothetical protein
MRAFFDDSIQNIIQPANATMLPFHPSELHRPIIASFPAAPIVAIID